MQIPQVFTQAIKVDVIEAKHRIVFTGGWEREKRGSEGSK